MGIYNIILQYYDSLHDDVVYNHDISYLGLWTYYRLPIRTRIIGPCARTLDLPLLVRSGGFFFLFLFCLVGADFLCPFSKGGNFRLHSTWSDYSSSYGYATVANEESVRIYIIRHQIQYEEGVCGMVW